MKNYFRYALFAALTASASAQTPMELEIVDTGTHHQLSWNTVVDYNYKVYMSPDLVNWTQFGDTEPGTGSTITYGLMNTADKLFYRVEETPALNFLALPEQGQEFDLIDGVCFSFNLNIFPSLPDKIRIYQRVYDSGDPWTQIGLITDFDEIDGIKFVRGSAVWIPDATGEYEIQATAVDGSGNEMANEIRRVDVGSNQAPSITITAGPTTPSASSQPALFTAIATDPDGDEVRRVEYYDNGILIGTDTNPTEINPGEYRFDSSLQDLEGSFNAYNLLKGTHNITAKAYDSRGAVGETVSASQYVITGGNSRPTISVISPSNGHIVTQGQNFTIAYAEGDPDGPADIDRVEAYNLGNLVTVNDTAAPFDDLTFDTTGWTPGTHTIRVLTRDQSGANSYPVYVTIVVRTGAGTTFAETLVASIVDETTAAPSNELFTGVEKSSGIFSSGEESGLEIDSGALLTTGSFALWNGGDDAPNDADEYTDESDDMNFGVNREEPGDPELHDRVVGEHTLDAAILEFNVDCLNGQLELVYQFGSEEYEEFVGEHNDGFMATVNGVLVTLVPDCSDIVAVNSVYPLIDDMLPGANEHLFLDDDKHIDANVDAASGDQYFQAEYDGMTIRLKAHVFLTPGSTPRVKLVIADVDDDQYDSGLFIEESSVRTINPQP